MCLATAPWHDSLCSRYFSPDGAAAHLSRCAGGNHTYPGQLQIMLNEKYPGKYSVTNLGACGSTMLKISNSPYWQRPQYKTLISNKWDIIIIMLGTNDAKDTDDHGPNNWLHNCGGVNHTTLEGCSFASDYAAMINVIKKLGTTPGGPVIYTVGNQSLLSFAPHP